MKIKLFMTKQILDAPVEVLKLKGKANNLINYLACQTIEDVCYVWDRLDGFRGVGAGTKNKIHSSVVNYMIENLDDATLQEFLIYLLTENTIEELEPFAKQIRKFRKAAA